MFSLVNYVYDWLITPTRSKDYYKNELEKELEKLSQQCAEYDKSQEVPEQIIEPESSNCFQKIGTITSMEANHGVIDDTIWFDLNASNRLHATLNVGCKVSYLAYRYSDDIPIKVVRIQSIVNEQWDQQPTDLQTEHLLTEIHKDAPEYFTVHQRSVLGTIVERREGLLTIDTDNNEPVIVDLEKVKSQFVPMIGDSVYLNCNVQSDMSFVDMVGEILNVTAIHPARSNATKGLITNCDHDRRIGDVDRTYFFTYDALDLNYMRPAIGDEVCIDVIESEQGSMSWRCIKVVLMTKSQKPDNDQSENETQRSTLTQNKNGIILGEIEKACLTEPKQTVDVKLIVKNTNTHPVRVVKSFFMSKKHESQVQMITPQLYDTFSIPANEEHEFHFRVRSKFYGQSKEMFVVCFENFVKIGRYIEIEVEDDAKSSSIGSGINKYRNKSYTKQIWDQNYDIIPGMKIKKNPNFIYVRMGMYDVPNSLKTAVLSLHTNTEVNEKLDYILPFFKEPLTFSNYQQRFNNLLYLEEIQHFHNMRRYDRDRAHFKREKEFLALQVENIAETRPSLVLGDSVRATNPWDKTDRSCFEGIIHKVLQDRVLLKFTQSFHDKYNGEDYRLEFYFSRNSFRKQHHAVEKAWKKLGRDFLFPSQITLQKPQLDVEIVDGYLMENNELIPWHNDTLNKVQKEAIKNVLRGETRPMPYIIFGPPGTGKTITVIETILQICTKVKGSRILVGTPSNSSANLITERIIKSGVLLPGDFIRIVGQNAVERESIPEFLLPYCATCDISCEGTVKDEMIVTESGLKLRCNSTYLGRHRITIGTCVTLGSLMHMHFPKDHFTHVIIDECGQCVESEALIPMTLLNRSSGQIIMAGDPMQLGPIILSHLAVDRGLDVSFLVRILERFPYQKDFTRFRTGWDPRLVTKLVYNYRSLPSILKLYSDLFYGSELIPTIVEGSSAESKMLQKTMRILPNHARVTQNHGIFFVGIKGINRQSVDSPSWFNCAEAKSVFFFLLKLYKLGINNADIGIITPYLQQVKAIRSLINDSNVLMPKVGTVEEFQGQERHIIIISTVRSSNHLVERDQKHSLGFVRSGKRLNVAVSRAKSLLVIFGNPHLLICDSQWKHLIEYCVQNRAYVGCDLPPSLDVENDN